MWVMTSVGFGSIFRNESRISGESLRDAAVNNALPWSVDSTTISQHSEIRENDSQLVAIEGLSHGRS